MNMFDENMLEVYKNNYVNSYNNFIEQLRVIFTDESTQKTLQSLTELSNELKLSNGQLLMSLLTEEYFNLFLKKKIKVFSHKNPDTKAISDSLFGQEFSLKNLLNNQPDEVKEVIWSYLHVVALDAEYTRNDKNNTSRMQQLNESIINTLNLKKYDSSSNETPKHKLQDMLGVSVNADTTAMIDDIVQSFEKVLSGDATGSNPLSGIMEVSQKISVKYADKINSGEIELEKLMQAITKKVPGMEEMMSGMLNLSKTKKQPQERIIMDENFSTASVPLGMNKEEESKQINIGNVLKMADQFGVIPGGKNSSDTPSLEGFPGLDGISGLGKVMEMMQKLDKTETKEDAEKLKQEMDEFLQKELGVDVTKLNEQLDAVTKQMQENNHEKNNKE